ncbi:MAG: PEGA domain-containing protein [Myxococcales bacterium]|nr:PEGA domain-containing protein [Myxococcales bacterium]
MRLLLSALLILALTAVAGAQPATEPTEVAPLPSDDELAEILSNPVTTAADAYELGRRFFEERRYEAAEQAWLRAFALARDPKLLVAVADTRQRRGDEPGAVAMLEQYLAERPDAPDAESVNVRIATLLESPAVLLVRSKQVGRAILLDGVPSTKKTPAELEVDPGVHVVVVVGDGKQVGEKTVQVGYGEVRELDFLAQAPSDLLVKQSKDAKLAAQLAVEREDQTIRRAVISTGSIAAASLVTGAVLGGLALRRDKDARTNANADRSQQLAFSAEVCLGLAALSAITSFTLFMTHKNKRKRERKTARLHIETLGAGASATLRF